MLITRTGLHAPAERTESFWRSGQRSPLSPDFHLGMLPIGKSGGDSDRKNDPASERSTKLNIYMICPVSGFKD
ncbi:hypothetical protein [Paenibacillus sp. S28]|uniref:hypothetical protein n=1 Tax=Paenibacillus sp. S28 TaxID=2767463 RepID=UPI00190A37A4|nr:hypothetical protein [Paenibacillus sp. S28]MBJ9993662.1 hypothetical protein [Paenibacillus sp. S28]